MRERIRGLWKVLFGRTTIFVFLILIQLTVIIGGIGLLGMKEILIANYAVGVLAIIVLIYLINNRLNSSFKLMWIILIVATPLIGVPFFLYTRLQPGTRYIARRVDEQINDQRPWLLPENDTVDRLIIDSGNEYGLFKYMYEEAHYPVYDGCGLEYYPFGQDKFEALLRELRKAERFIFLEYFIIGKGEMWGEVLKILRQKVKEGVEVRVLYDGTNTMLRLPKSYPNVLKAWGIDCRVFSPMKPVITTHQNFRDHRKIVVIDGHTAFTGGVNLADEYINRKNRFGVWKDSAVMVKGKAVNSFTLMFLQMWNVGEEAPVYEPYLRQAPDCLPPSDGFVMPYAGSPLDGERTAENVFIDILYRAVDYVHIMTPYLILDNELENALKFAAKRGVDVKIILPGIPDKKTAYALAKTHYRVLIEAGVRIFEYTPGFVHAKICVSDGQKAVVGTINFDYRSLYHHFECAAYLYRCSCIAGIEDDFLETLSACREVTPARIEEEKLSYRLTGMLLKCVAPLM